MTALPVILLLTLGQYGPWVGIGINPPTGSPSPYSGALDWSRSWSADWGSGVPAPSIDCVADGAAGYVCTGATAVAGGSGTTAGTAAGYPERTATVYNGSGWHSLGAVGAVGTLTACAIAKTDASNAASIAILGRYDTTGQAWLLYRYGTDLKFDVYKADNSGSYMNPIGAIAVGQWFIVCVSYLQTTDGASTMRANLNGTAPTAITNAVGPMQATSKALTIAANASGNMKWAGAVARVSVWPGWAADAATLATMVASQQARQITKPAATLATVTSPATTCVGASGTLYSLPANSLCVGASGAEVWGAAQHSNLAINSSAHNSWTKEGMLAVDEGSASCPLGPTGVRMNLITFNGDQGIYESVSGGAGTYTHAAWMARATADSDCTATLTHAYSAGAGDLTVSLTATPTRFVKVWTATGSEGPYYFKRLANTCTRMCVWGTSYQASAVLGPYVPTAGAPVSGTADNPKIDAQIASKDKWALGILATPAGGWGRTSGIGLLQWGGAYGAANSVSVYTDTSANLILEVYDNAGTPAWKRWTSTAALTGTNEKAVAVTNNGGTWSVIAADCPASICADYQTLAGSLSGTGTGLQTALPQSPNNTVAIGVVGSSYLNGPARKVCQGKDWNGLKRCLR